jgi:hypothetical protein
LVLVFTYDFDRSGKVALDFIEVEMPTIANSAVMRLPPKVGSARCANRKNSVIFVPHRGLVEPLQGHK